jgi:ABC-type spermidine/putrescine transport system permease subunit II
MTGFVDARPAAAREAFWLRVAVGATLVTGSAVTALIYLPVVLLGLLSVSRDPMSGIPGGFTLTWYGGLFRDTRWVRPLVLSLEIAAVVSVLCMMAALLVGRILPRLRRYRATLLLIFLMPLIVPGIVLGVQEFAFFRALLSIRTGIWSILLTHFLWAFPFALLGMLVVTLRFDMRLLEAAADLGASPWRRFWDIERPLMMPGISTAGMFGFLLSLTELPRSLFVRGGETTLPLFTWAEAASRASHVPLIFCLNSLVALASVALSVASVAILSRGRT